MKIKKVAVLGAGAVGSYVIWGLSALGSIELGVVAQGERAQRLRTNGCSIKPYLDALGENEKTEFLGELLEAVKENIPVQGDENVILKMPRLFFTAKK